KPRFIADLQGGAEVIYGPLETGAYDLVIDATGEARAYAPPLRDDLKARVVQWRVRTTEAAPLAFMPTAGVPGYAWIMPLDPEGREVQVGASWCRRPERSVGCCSASCPPQRTSTISGRAGIGLGFRLRGGMCRG